MGALASVPDYRVWGANELVLFYNAGAIDRLPLLVEALLLLIPAATLASLTAYVVRYSPHD